MERQAAHCTPNLVLDLARRLSPGLPIRPENLLGELRRLLQENASTDS